jgi:uncharacterized Zn finger protein
MSDPGTRMLAKAMFEAALVATDDPGRLSRGRALVRNNAVLDIDVIPGVISGRVMGSMPTPYSVSLHAPPSAWAMAGAAAADDELDAAALKRLIPDIHRVSSRCDCPDAANPCKHGLALGFQFAQRLAFEPQLLVIWRSAPPERAGAAGDRVAQLVAARHESASRERPVAEVPPPAPISAEMREFLGLDRALPPRPAVLAAIQFPRALVGPVDVAMVVDDALSVVAGILDRSPR